MTKRTAPSRRWDRSILGARWLTCAALVSASARCSSERGGPAAAGPNDGGADTRIPVDGGSGSYPSSADVGAGDTWSAPPSVEAGVADSGSAEASLPHTFGACSDLADAGTWEDITPPQVKAQLPGPGSCTFGTGSFVLDWSASGTIYLGTCNMGIWKSTDCGSTWVHINTGANGSTLDTGRQWTFSIDPVDPKILYTNSGYGAQSNGAFKSTNGGVDWQSVWPGANGTYAGVANYDFVQLIAMDPTNRLHLLLSFHSTCNAPYTSTCLAESTDGGETWQVKNGESSWSIQEAQYVYFLANSRTWLWALGSNGLWRSADAGNTWSVVAPNAGGHNFAPAYQASDGTFYLTLNTGLYRSPDGITWTTVMTQPAAGITGNGTTLFASVGFPWNLGQGPSPYQPFYTSPETNGVQWTQLPSPSLSNGGTLAYDTDHHVLYSSNLNAGFYRVVTP
jgi:hypothetical protein